MPLVLLDRAQQTGTANTTVSFTLSGSVTGFQSLAGIGNTNTTYYSATDASGNWEAGLGTYSTTGPTLTRTTVYSSSNSNTAVTFSGTVNVFVTYPSSRSVNLDASGIATIPASMQVNSLGVGTPASGTAGEIRATNNITAFYSSDIKFKENIRPIENALDKIKLIGGKEFDWTDEYIDSHGGEDGYFVAKEDFGVVAQDVQKIFPKAVKTRPDGSLAVDYTKLGVLAFQGILELLERVEALEAK